jgi:ABC-type phosphate transport system substrate-binding protein
LATGLGDSGAAGPSVVWQTSNSCTGVQSVYGPNSTGTPYMMQDPDAGSPASAYAQYYGPDGKTTACLVGDGGVPVDVGESDVYASTCPAYSSYTNQMQVPDIHGPIQAMAFVVPKTSHATSISQEAAREVFGTGGMNGVMSSWNPTYVPWIDPTFYAIRNKNTGTQQMIGKAIGVPADQFWGIDQGSASEVVNFLIAQASGANADEAIGILSLSVYDSDRSNPTLNLNNMQTLAYQAAGQRAAYLPDSTAASYDKQNVRDGHYPIWGPLHFFYLNSNLNSNLTAATAFVNYFGGATIAESLIDAFISANLIPACAMNVQQVPQQVGEELGPLEPSTVQSCDCHFLQKVLSPPSSLPPECLECSSNGQCPETGRTTCFLGYCEVPGKN